MQSTSSSSIVSRLLSTYALFSSGSLILCANSEHRCAKCQMSDCETAQCNSCNPKLLFNADASRSLIAPLFVYATQLNTHTTQSMCQSEQNALDFLSVCVCVCVILRVSDSFAQCNYIITMIFLSVFLFVHWFVWLYFLPFFPEQITFPLNWDSIHQHFHFNSNFNWFVGPKYVLHQFWMRLWKCHMFTDIDRFVVSSTTHLSRVCVWCTGLLFKQQK